MKEKVKRSYKVVCISMYHEDIANAKALVAELKRVGYTKANFSWLVRTLLNKTSVDELIAILPPPNTF